MQRKLLVPLVASTVALGACGGDKPVGPKVTDGPVALAVNVSCSGSTPLALAVGAVRQVSADELASLCLSSGAGSEYALIPVYTLGDPAKPITLDVSATGTSAPASTLSLGGPDAPRLAVAALGGGAAPAYSRNVAFDARLRDDERALFTERAADARASYDAVRSRRGGALYSVASSVPAVGALLTLNANSSTSCTSPTMRTGRVVAVTRNAVVVADTLNPANGFTDAEYASIGADFDTLAYAVDTLNFGKPADIDANGDRAVIFFTKAVNDLTPVTSQSYVGGFFYGRDLYPKTTSGGLQGCAGSNYAEMFYTLVPDPVRAGNNANSPFTKASVKELTVAVLAHELQHLINESRRLYVTRTSAEEVTWLNEGLSHVAEELVFFRASGLATRHNLTIDSLRTSARAVNAYNQFERSNLGRLLTYLPSTELNSPVANNDSLETRGATWDLLRYSADRKGGTERDTWYSLVNSNTSGLANLQNVFGPAAFGGTRPWLRDWAVSHFTDDAGIPVAPEFTKPSWNFRNLLPAVTKGAAYPLNTHPLVPGTPVTLKLAGGAGVGYLKFKVGTNVAGTVQKASTAMPAGLDLMLVRVQ